MRKQPQRQCVACKARKDKSDLLRVVSDSNGNLVYDSTGKAPGRGAYLCKSEDCIKSELKKAARLSKGLRREISQQEIDAVASEILDKANG